MAFWLKLYTDMLGDPKLMRAARDGAKSLEFLPWLLLFGKQADDSGRLTVGNYAAQVDDIARTLPIPMRRAVRVVAECLGSLEDLGILERQVDGVLAFTAWGSRQGKRPSEARERVAERVRQHRARQVNGNDDVTSDVTRQSKSESKTQRKSETRDVVTETAPDAPPPEPVATLDSPAIQSLKLPKDAIDFLAMFYEPAMTERARQRYRAVQSQLWDTLAPGHPGPKIRGGTRVKARSEAHLSETCRAVMADPPTDRDMAVVFVLKRLTNPEKGPSESERAAAAEQLQIQADTAEYALRKRRALAWAHDPANAARYAEIEKAINREFPNNNGGGFAAIAREAALVARCSDAGKLSSSDADATPPPSTAPPAARTTAAAGSSITPPKPADERDLVHQFNREQLEATRPWSSDDANRDELAAVIAEATAYIGEFADTSWGKSSRDKKIIELIATKVHFPNFDDWKRARSTEPPPVTVSQKGDKPMTPPVTRQPCTGVAARWCPVHGDCTGRARNSGHCDDRRCPLHGDASTHPELEPSDGRTPTLAPATFDTDAIGVLHPPAR